LRFASSFLAEANGGLFVSLAVAWFCAACGWDFTLEMHIRC
jgi:hypothetical protein